MPVKPYYALNGKVFPEWEVVEQLVMAEVYRLNQLLDEIAGDAESLQKAFAAAKLPFDGSDAERELQSRKSKVLSRLERIKVIPIEGNGSYTIQPLVGWECV